MFVRALPLGCYSLRYGPEGNVPYDTSDLAVQKTTGKDLWLLYSDKKLHGQDPEFYNSGGVAMPIQPQVVFSLDLGV